MVLFVLGLRALVTRVFSRRGRVVGTARAAPTWILVAPGHDAARAEAMRAGRP